MNAFQSAAPKGKANSAPAICLRPGDILTSNGKVIRKQTLDERVAPIITVAMTQDEKDAYRNKRLFDDRWEPGRRSLHRRF